MPFVPDTPAPATPSTGGSFVPDSPQTPPGDTRSVGEIMNEGDMPEFQTPRQAGLAVRGAVGGFVSPLTMAGDLGIGTVNWIKRHVYDAPDSDLLHTNLSDIAEKGLTNMGFPEPKDTGERAISLASGLVGGFASGVEGSGPKVLQDATGDTGNAARWSAWANAGSGQNKKILTNLVARDIGVEGGADRLTPDVLNQAATDIGSKLDYFRNPKQLYLYDPAQMAADIAKANTKWTGKTNDLANMDVVDRLQNIFNSSHVTGEDLGQMSSELGKARAAAGEAGAYQKARGLGELQDKVEDLIKTGLSPQDKTIYEKALQQYKTLQGVMEGNNLQGGYINPGNYANYIGRNDPMGLKAGQNGSPVYQVLRKVQEQMGISDPSLAGTLSHSQAMTALKAIARWAPGKVQWAAQVGIPTAIRAFANQPGFVASMTKALNEDGHDVSE